MNKLQAMQNLCIMDGVISKHLHGEVSACFCDTTREIEEEVIEFMIKAINEKIQRET